MNTQLQLDYPVWRMSFSAYAEHKGYDLSQTESFTDWLDHRPKEKFDYQPAPDEERDFYINDADAGSFEGDE